MEQLAYSSIAAFLAHYRILRDAATNRGGAPLLSTCERDLLNAMDQVTEALTPEERAILLDRVASPGEKHESGEARRRRERAEIKLHRLLLSRGVIRA